MLFLQKSIVEGTLALLLQCYLYLDLEKVSDKGESQRYKDLLDLLTPVAKTCGAEWGQVSANNGLQVLGGYGYTEDFILEQLVRDIRIMSLYEGTTGIHSLTLLGRQIPMNESRALKAWKEEVMKDIEEARHIDDLIFYAKWLEKEILDFESMTKELLVKSLKADPEIFLSDANLYMELFGYLNISWQWLKQAVVARNVLDGKRNAVQEKNFYRSKIETMQFYFHYELVKTKGLFTRLKDGMVLTLWKEEDGLI
jgi:butyryl-CoA dehydrogenase